MSSLSLCLGRIAQLCHTNASLPACCMTAVQLLRVPLSTDTEQEEVMLKRSVRAVLETLWMTAHKI